MFARPSSSNVNAEQAKAIQGAMCNSSIGLGNRVRSKKPVAEMSEADKEALEIVRSLKKTKGQLTAAHVKATQIIRDLTGNKHALASKLKAQIEKHIDALKKREEDMEHALLMNKTTGKSQQASVKKMIHAAETLLSNCKNDFKIAKSI